MSARITKLPILILNPWNRCNCRCVMCDIWKRDPAQGFGEAELRSQMDAIEKLGVEWVVLTGGEPLMQPGLFELCGLLRTKRIRITLLSSGLLLRRHAARIAEVVDEVIVSLDGPPALHNRIRNVERAWELMGEGIAAIRALHPGFPTAGRCTVQRLNCGHLVDTMLAARDLKLDSISFLAADTHSDAFDHRLPVSNGIALSASDLAILESQLEGIIEAGHCSAFVLESPEKLRRIAAHFRAALGLCPPVSPVCNAPWNSAVVETDGTVRPCFFHQPIGRITEREDLAAVINGEAGQKFRATLDVAANPVCQRCVCSLNYSSQSDKSRPVSVSA